MRCTYHHQRIKPPLLWRTGFDAVVRELEPAIDTKEYAF